MRAPDSQLLGEMMNCYCKWEAMKPWCSDSLRKQHAQHNLNRSARQANLSVPKTTTDKFACRARASVHSARSNLGLTGKRALAITLSKYG